MKKQTVTTAVRGVLTCAAAYLMVITITYSCGNTCNESIWADDNTWYREVPAPSDSLADVFYIISTVLQDSHDTLGNESFTAVLTDEEKTQMKREMSYARFMFGDSLNFISPYYHQYTMNSILLPEDGFRHVYNRVTDEVCEAFDYYMENVNNGRRFILAGFSQGAMLTLELLKHMTPEQYSRLAAAYMIGYRLTSEDLQHPQVKDARKDDDQGVVISFNSVISTDDIWPFVTGGASTCINPLNWRTDDTPATLRYHDDVAEVHVDQQNHVLVVKGLDAEKYHFKYGDGYYNRGCLHHWDLLFYRDALRANALLRAYGRKAS